MYDIIIVGAGPAGLTAALYAKRANKNVLVIEAKTYGGQILNASRIDNYPGIKFTTGFEYATNLYNQVKDLGCEFAFETVVRVNEDRTVITNKNTYKAKAVILATGSQNRKLNIPDETNYLGKGISYCATCDGNFFKEKNVAVVGGGNSAFEDALYLSDIASKVYLIHRRDEYRADDNLVNMLKKKNNVEYILNAEVSKLNGNDKLESVDLKINNDKIETINIEGLFIAIGQEPKNEIFTNVVDLNERGYMLSDDGVHSKVKGIYIAGDTRDKMLRQLTTAVSDGSIAATMAIKEMPEL